MNDSNFFLRDKRLMMSFHEKKCIRSFILVEDKKTKEKSSIQKYRESASFDLF